MGASVHKTTGRPTGAVLIRNKLFRSPFKSEELYFYLKIALNRILWVSIFSSENTNTFHVWL
jgi:hypothetical protein